MTVTRELLDKKYIKRLIAALKAELLALLAVIDGGTA